MRIQKFALAAIGALLLVAGVVPALADGGITFTDIVSNGTSGITFQHGPSAREADRLAVIADAAIHPIPTADYFATVRPHSPEKSWGAPGVAVFDCSGMVWVGAAGFSDKNQLVPAGAGTVFRAGALTDALTALVMMRLVDRGVLDLDAPVRRYLPDFAPQNPFQTQITLRMLATHSSGLVREPPLGSYFATTAPDLASIVRSLNDTQLLARPGTVTKYSNAGAAVIGRVLEVVTGKSYAELMRDELFAPARMSSSSIRLADSAGPISYAEMQSYDAPRVPISRSLA